MLQVPENPVAAISRKGNPWKTIDIVIDMVKGCLVSCTRRAMHGRRWNFCSSRWTRKFLFLPFIWTKREERRELCNQLLKKICIRYQDLQHLIRIYTVCKTVLSAWVKSWTHTSGHNIMVAWLPVFKLAVTPLFSHKHFITMINSSLFENIKISGNIE